MIKKYFIYGLAALSIGLSGVSHADDREIWARITQIFEAIGTTNNHVSDLKKEVELIKSQRAAKHYIGEQYHGGIVFYVDETGQRGLIASLKDINDQGIQWRNGASGNKITNAKGNGIGSGETNTRLIIASQTIDNQKGQFAALSASQFQIQADGISPCAPQSICYGGWYLPSAYELQLMHANLHQRNLTQFTPDFYWASTEASASNAWLINFSTGELTASNKSNTTGRVRAISHF